MIYFDHASTSYPKPREVINGISEYLENIGVSPGRGSYAAQDLAAHCVDQTRKQIADLFGIHDSAQIVFTNNATHSLNIILKGYLKENDHVLVCSYSHNSVIRPLEHLKRLKNIHYDFFHVDQDGNIDVNQLKKLLRPNTVLAVLNHASNVLGVRSKFEKILPFFLEQKIATLLDVAQTAGIIPLQVETLGIDFVAGTGHKTLLGPSGIGFLYLKDADIVSTFLEGGSGGNSSSSPIHPEVMPEKFEAGTINYMGVAGLSSAMTMGLKISYEKMMHDCLLTTEYAWRQLSLLPEIQLYGSSDIAQKVPIISFCAFSIPPQTIAQILDKKYTIAVRAGLQCAPMCHKQVGTYPAGTVRVSFGHTNSFGEVDYFIDAMKQILREA